MDFKEAYELPIGKHVEKKGRFSYLSWPFAVKFLRENFPGATWEIKHFDDRPYMQTPAGCFVEVGVWVEDMLYLQVHPVLDNQNKTIYEPNAFQVNTSIQRCLVKAISIATGIGLGLYAKEDLPVEEVSTDVLSKEQAQEIRDLLVLADMTEEFFVKKVKCPVDEIYAVYFDQNVAKLKERAKRFKEERG